MKKEFQLTDKQFGYLLLIPATAFFLSIIIYPIARNVYLSFHQKSILTGMQPQFVGGSNYFRIITKDLWFKNALFNTIKFTLISVSIEFILGLGFALVLNFPFKGRNFARAAAILPWALPTAVMATAWRWIYNDMYGVSNDILLKLGIIDEAVAWLGNPATAMYATIFADVWKTTSFITLILLAGLQSIPKSLYSAAEVDGANVWQRFKHVTLPLLRPAIVLALLFRTLQAFAVFDLIWVLTQGGPAGTTATLSVYIYDYIFRYLKLGYGAALNMMVFFFALIIIFAILAFRRREVEI